jgi:hypothetical protein
MSGSIQDVNWREVFPRGVLDPFGPSDEPVFTPTDRRLLWHIQYELPSTGYLGRLRLALYRYLCETCEHHWRDYAASEDRHPDTGELLDRIPAHRQCLWCSEVEWRDGTA